MVYILQAGIGGLKVFIFPCPKARHKSAMVVLAFNKQVHRFAIGVYAADHYFSAFVFQALWFHIAPPATAGSLLPRISSIVYPQGQELYAIAMFINMISYFVMGTDGC